MAGRCERTKKLLCAAVIMLALFIPAGAARALDEAKAPQVEVAFVLDTTGSMSGLIEGAKAKIWAIANEIIAGKPKPKLKIGLIGYRDRGDDYVTKLFDLSEDIDKVYTNLQQFQAAGGGDHPESVNQALGEAVDKIGWTSGPDTLKIVFLVGDAPPHMDYANDVKYQQLTQQTVRKNLIINTVQCGEDQQTKTVWQEIAKLGEGKYLAVAQTGDMQVVKTPVDEELAGVNSDLGRTTLAYGSVKERSAVARSVSLAESMPAPAALDRMGYKMKAEGAAVGGGAEKDLVTAVNKGAVNLDSLKDEELPDEFKGKSKEEREALLKEKSAKRAELQAKAEELMKKRQQYIDAEQAKRAREGKKSAFDEGILDMLREEAKSKGISY